jgi:hypothetical protein
MCTFFWASAPKKLDTVREPRYSSPHCPQLAASRAASGQQMPYSSLLSLSQFLAPGIYMPSVETFVGNNHLKVFLSSFEALDEANLLNHRVSRKQ